MTGQTLDELIVRLAVQGDAQVKAAMTTVDQSMAKTEATAKRTTGAVAQGTVAVRQAGSAAAGAAISFGGLQSPILGAAAAMSALALSARQIGAGLLAATGVGIAAQFQKIEVGMANMLGSAEKAKQLMKELRLLGATTEFNTQGLVGLAGQLLATGSTPKGVTREIRALTDAAAFAQVGDEGVTQLATNMAQIRNAPKPELEDLKQFGTNRISLDKVVGAALGQAMSGGEGIRKLQKMSGKDAFETIVLGMEKAYGGSAQRLAGSMIGLAVNLREAFETIMLPTGKLLIPVLALGAKALTLFGVALGRVNEVTGGAGGAILLATALARGWALVVSAIASARNGINQLIASLNALAGSAAMAAGTTGVQAAANARGAAAVGGTAAAKGLFLPSGPGTAAAAATPAAKASLWSRIGGGAMSMGRGLMGFLRGGAGIGILASLGGGLIGNAIGGDTGNTISSAATGAGLGAAIGSVIPGLGTAAGGIIGGILGLGKGLYDSFSKDNKDGEIAQNTKKAADALQEIRGELIGGGARARGGMTDAEIAMARMMATGYA